MPRKKKELTTQEKMRELGRKSAQKRDAAYYSELGKRSAAKRMKRRGFRRHMSEISLKSRTPKVATKFCRHCGDPLSDRNRSGFCRNCRRSHSLSTLQRITVGGTDVV